MTDIELRIQTLDQLFDSLDPAPFHAKALDRNAEAYLLESAAEHGARTPDAAFVVVGGQAFFVASTNSLSFVPGASASPVKFANCLCSIS